MHSPAKRAGLSLDKSLAPRAVAKAFLPNIPSESPKFATLCRSYADAPCGMWGPTHDSGFYWVGIKLYMVDLLYDLRI
jgi:hypothetical protein